MVHEVKENLIASLIERGGRRRQARPPHPGDRRASNAEPPPPSRRRPGRAARPRRRAGPPTPCSPGFHQRELRSQVPGQGLDRGFGRPNRRVVADDEPRPYRGHVDDRAAPRVHQLPRTLAANVAIWERPGRLVDSAARLLRPAPLSQHGTVYRPLGWGMNRASQHSVTSSPH